MQLSKNFSLQELIYSSTAEREGISNEPSEEEIDNLQDLAENVLQCVRDHFGLPLVVHSGFRCFELNAKVGGAPTSDHLKGKAADFSIRGVSNYEICRFIETNCNFRQCINEKSGDRTWVHVSYDREDNKMETLTYVRGRYERGLRDVA